MKVLIMEDPNIVPTILRLLRLAEDHTGEKLEPVIAACSTEADMRLPECDIAIIDIEYDGGNISSIANRAVNDIGMPVMATTIRSYYEMYMMEKNNLRFVSRLDWQIARFRKIMVEFIELVRQRADIISFAA
jgi:hypothetical protein